MRRSMVNGRKHGETCLKLLHAVRNPSRESTCRPANVTRHENSEYFKRLRQLGKVTAVRAVRVIAKAEFLLKGH